MKKSLLLFTFLMAVVSALEAKSVDDIYFIRLNIDENRIELGEFSATLSKQVVTGFDADAPPEKALPILENFFNDHITPEQRSSVLFFIHAMWGSNNWFVRSQVVNFRNSYIEDDNSPVQQVFYILWDTKRATYGGNKHNAIESSDLLYKLFSLLGEVNKDERYTFNLMCHSMGNKVFFDMAEHQSIQNRLFDHIVFAAPDVDREKIENEQVTANLNTMAGSCHVLYNHDDGLLILSRIRNGYVPLGLDPKTNIATTQLTFENCSFLTDNNKFPSSVTGHLYYSTSMATKRKIKQLLAT